MFVENRRDRRKLLFISISGSQICFKSIPKPEERKAQIEDKKYIAIEG